MTSNGSSVPDHKLRRIAILGSTGSIGRQTLEVVKAHPDRLQVVAVAGWNAVEELAAQVTRFGCRYAGIAGGPAYERLSRMMPPQVRVLTGQQGLCEMASLPEVDLVVVAISGAAGILPTVSAIKGGKTVALANKETLVAAGDVVMAAARRYQVDILPVDSEHSAVFQCLRDERRDLKCIWLTASGGPFRGCSREEMAGVTPQMALQHPNWKMGPKITVDSATLVNKGLEVIEAHHLFGAEYDSIRVVVHPQSRVHSLVEFIDGSFLAHLGVADMRIPIQYALSYPERWASPGERLDLTTMGALEFMPPDLEAFPGLGLALAAGREGGTLPAVMNAANEEAVQYFLAGQIKFNRIPELIARVMAEHHKMGEPSLEDILLADDWARQRCRNIVERK